MSQTSGGTSLVDVARHLEGLSLPASKQDVVRHVRSKGANTDEVTAIERLPDQDFTTVADILKGIGQVTRLGSGEPGSTVRRCRRRHIQPAWPGAISLISIPQRFGMMAIAANGAYLVGGGAPA